MTERYGTAHFVSIAAAVRYYAKQEISRHGVFEKIGRGEIFIGPPVAPIGHKAILNDEEGRYFILEWSLEQADYQLMLELTRKQSDWTYTKETRETSQFLPAAYNKAYYQGRQ